MGSAMAWFWASRASTDSMPMPGSPGASVAKLTVARTPSALAPLPPRKTASTVPGRGESATPSGISMSGPGAMPTGCTRDAFHARRTDTPFTVPTLARRIGTWIVSA